MGHSKNSCLNEKGEHINRNDWPLTGLFSCFQFKRMAATKKPTGSRKIHPAVRKAKQLYAQIAGAVHVGSLGLHSEDLGNSSGTGVITSDY